LNQADIGAVSSNSRKRKKISENIELLAPMPRAMHNGDKLMVKGEDRNKLLKKVCNSMVEVCGYCSVWVALVDESLRVGEVAESGLGESFRDMSEGLKRGEFPDCGYRALMQSGVVLTTEQHYTCNDCHLVEKCSGGETMTIRLEHANKVHGLLSISLPKSFTAGDEEQALVEEIARDIAFALNSVELNERYIRAEGALQESEEHYSTLIGSLVDAVFEFKEGVLVWCNDRVEEIYGYTRDELIGRNAKFFFPEGMSVSEFVQRISGAIKERGLFRGMARVKKKDGTLADIEYSISRTPTKDPIRVIVVARDITERKQAESERERLLMELAEMTRELEQIVYVASHDLRSPLVNIQGFTRELDESFAQVHEIFNSKDVPPGVKKKLVPILDEDIPVAFQYILASSSKMDSLLSGLLRLSRLGQAALNIKQLDMNKLMAEVVASFEFQVKESGARIMVEALPPCHGDETQVNQVFSNLVDNALKFLDADRPGMIRISGKEEGGRVTYCVEDNGIGIADKDRERIFEIFCRLNPDASAGEGLGLAIVRKILDRHVGKVWVESEPGKGSRFFVSLQTKEGTNDKK